MVLIQITNQTQPNRRKPLHNWGFIPVNLLKDTEEIGGELLLVSYSTYMSICLFSFVPLDIFVTYLMQWCLRDAKRPGYEELEEGWLMARRAQGPGERTKYNDFHVT